MHGMPEPQRMSQVQTPMIPVVHELIRQYPGTISFGQGVVHYGPPAQVTDAIEAFQADPNNHKYQDVAGISELVQLIESKLKEENRITIGPGRSVVVTAGGNMAFMNAMFVVTDPGDEVVILSPYYFNHEMAISMVGCRSVVVATDKNCQIDVAAIENAVGPRTRAVVTISPNNPTGAVYGETSLRAVNELCRQRGIYHIHDEAYEYFTYDAATHFSPGSIAGSDEHTISLYSLSKAYGFASWRIGYMVIPQKILLGVKKAQDTVLICPPVVSQYAAAAAMRVGSSYCKDRLAGYGQVRSLVLEELKAVQHVCTVPRADGAFYFLLRLDTTMDAMALVERLISEYAVAVMPGTTFGMHEGCCLRISYGALEKDTVAEGMERLVKGLDALING